MLISGIYILYGLRDVFYALHKGIQKSSVSIGLDSHISIRWLSKTFKAFAGLQLELFKFGQLTTNFLLRFMPVSFAYSQSGGGVADRYTSISLTGFIALWASIMQSVAPDSNVSTCCLFIKPLPLSGFFLRLCRGSNLCQKPTVNAAVSFCCCACLLIFAAYPVAASSCRVVSQSSLLVASNRINMLPMSVAVAYFISKQAMFSFRPCLCTHLPSTLALG